MSDLPFPDIWKSCGTMGVCDPKMPFPIQRWWNSPEYQSGILNAPNHNWLPKSLS